MFSYVIGHMAYFGPIGSGGDRMIPYLEKLPGGSRCPEDMNPVYYMKPILKLYKPSFRIKLLILIFSGFVDVRFVVGNRFICGWRCTF